MSKNRKNCKGCPCQNRYFGRCFNLILCAAKCYDVLSTLLVISVSDRKVLGGRENELSDINKTYIHIDNRQKFELSV